MIEYLNELFTHVGPLAAYTILAVSAFVENTFPPIPGDTVTILGAYLVSTGKLDFWGVYFSTTAGSIVGFFSMYLLGRFFGRAFIRNRIGQKVFSEKQIDKVGVWFSRHGYWVIAGNRFLSGTRSVISIFAGLFHLKWWIVLVLSTISALVWNGLLIYAGYQLGVNWTELTALIGQYNKIVIALTVVVAGIFIYRWLAKKRKPQNEDVENQ